MAVYRRNRDRIYVMGVSTMKTEYTMLLHTIERKHGLNTFVTAKEGYEWAAVNQIEKAGYIDRVNKHTRWVTPRGQQYLAKVRAHFAQ